MEKVNTENTIGQRIKAVREHLGVSQQHMAARLLIPRAHLDNIESGAYAASSTLIRMICREYDIQRDWLFYGQGNPFQEREPEQKPLIHGCRTTQQDVQTYRDTPLLNDLYASGEEQGERERVTDTETTQNKLNLFLDEMRGRHLTAKAIGDLSDYIFDLTNEEYATGWRYGARDMVRLLMETLTIGGVAVQPEEKLRILADEEKLRLLVELTEQKSRPA